MSTTKTELIEQAIAAGIELTGSETKAQLSEMLTDPPTTESEPFEPDPMQPTMFDRPPADGDQAVDRQDLNPAPTDQDLVGSTTKPLKFCHKHFCELQRYCTAGKIYFRCRVQDCEARSCESRQRKVPKQPQRCPRCKDTYCEVDPSRTDGAFVVLKCPTPHCRFSVEIPTPLALQRAEQPPAPDVMDF